MAAGAASSTSKDVTVCLTFDFDAISIWVGPRRTRSPNLIARGEFGEVGAHRLLDLLADHRLPSTWFVPGHTIDTFPEVCARLAEAGHEIGYHGYCHEAPSSKRDEADERAILERAMGCIERLTGKPPVGHRLPGGNLGERWIAMLVDHGFSYDSSMAPRDTEPSWVRVGDEVRADGPYGFGRPVDLVELPFDWALDDWPYFAHDPGGPQAGLRSPRDVEAAWADEFDYLYDRVGRGVFVLTMHPQCIGRGGRLLMLERLVAHFAERPGVRFATMAEAADSFRRANPLTPA